MLRIRTGLKFCSLVKVKWLTGENKMTVFVKNQCPATATFSSTGQRPASYSHGPVSVVHQSIPQSVRQSICLCFFVGVCLGKSPSLVLLKPRKTWIMWAVAVIWLKYCWKRRKTPFNQSINHSSMLASIKSSLKKFFLKNDRLDFYQIQQECSLGGPLSTSFK